ncbi:hypothetical protein [Burkholderia territorii]|uniref:hypothetical protein n=1 Tax=Burkholderia territorii TaxID=1503055 RepID=UPI000A8BF591|nr:hypothetical protein [Burkholderia territorii]
MKKKLAALACLFVAVFDQALHAQPPLPPAWLSSARDEPQDSSMALNSPDEYAWRLFVSLNWPAQSGTRHADASKNIGDAGRTVWESWMLVSGGPKNSSVYKIKGNAPDDWTASLDSYCNATARDIAPLQQMFRATGHLMPQFDPGAAQPGTDEVRMNQSALEFITKSSLYYIEGQEALFSNGIRAIAFPVAAKEVKAQWREISPQEEPRYHSCHFNNKIYGLTAMHILTKDLPNWFWATFEHADNNSQAKIAKGTDAGYEEWKLPSKDSFSCPNNPVNCDSVPKGIGIDGTKWQYYRLRGTQINFVDSTGMATRLANSNIETGFQTTSSCMSCHARASIGARIVGATRANRLSIFEPPFINDTPFGPVGVPNPVQFQVMSGDTHTSPTPILTYTQLDFVWSLLRAQRRNP